MANSSADCPNTHVRQLVPLLACVALIGTLLAWWGRRDDRHSFGEPPREPMLASGSAILQSVQSSGEMVARGSEIEERYCAGCHDVATRSVGPSFQAIVSLYHRESANSKDGPEVLSKLAAGIEHPQPGWSNFEPGPPELGLTDKDRAALASWMLYEAGKTTSSAKD